MWYYISQFKGERIMKKIKLFAIIAIIATMMFSGLTSVNASTSIPDSVVSDNYKIVEYIDNYRVVVKTADNGKYYVYCMNLDATYDKGITFSKKSTVNSGFLYILNNKPNTGDADKDFYITQMAVWYYEDYLNQNNDNLQTEVKKYIVAHKDTEEVSGKIIELLNGAKTYTEPVGGLSIADKDSVTFTKTGDYYVSSVIKIDTKNLDGNLKYSLSNVPVGSLVVKSGDGVKVKIPVDSIKEGNQLKFSLNVSGSYTKQEAYYYYYNSNYQKVLLSEPLEKTIELSDSVNMIIRNYSENTVIISKTDITQSKEIPGATLTVKDSNGNLVATWVSTDTAKQLTLTTGEYSLNETIAPEGYRLSSTTIYFKLDEDGKTYIKNDKGNYVEVTKVSMINELLDVVSIAKKDSKTDAYLAGATMVIKDEKGNVVSEFVSTTSAYQLSLDAGTYTLTETNAPEGYILSDEVIYFQITEDGTLKVKNNKGEYADSAIVVYYNTPESKIDVAVPATGASSTLFILSGVALLIGGIACVKKTIKEC
jgi:hypothetical protein